MNKWAEIVLGLVILVGIILVSWISSAYSWNLMGINMNFLHAAWEFFKGGLVWLFILIGLLFILLGIADLRN